MKYLVSIVLLFLTTVAVSAQPKLNTDSLQRLLAVAKEDTTRIILMAQISSDFTFYNPDSAFELVKQALELANKINYHKGQIYCDATLGKLWWSVGDYSAALRYLLPLAKDAESPTDNWLRINILGFIIASYRDQGDLREALKYAFRFAYLENAYNQCKLCRHCYTAIASSYLEMGRLDSTLFYLQRAFSSLPIFGDDGWMYLVAGRTQTELHNYDSAFYFYRQSIPALTRDEDLKDLAGTYNNMAALFAKLQQSDSAFFYARKAMNIAHSKQYSRESMIANLILASAYESLNTDSAFRHYKLAMAAKDSLYSAEKQRQISNYKFTEELQQQEIKYTKEHYSYRLRLNAVLGISFTLLVVALLLWRNNSNKQKAYTLLQQQKKETDRAYEQLKSTQTQLIQSEKMASLGQLTAGIAHEIQNPLNFVNNFSEINTELIEELKEEIDKGDLEEVKAIVNDLKENEQKIIHHGKRADNIVKGMLQHSRASTGKKELTDINALVDECVRLSYHGMRAKDKELNAEIRTDFDESIGKINVVPQDISRVLINLLNNAFYAVDERKRQLNGMYEPAVAVCTKKLDGKVEIQVKDNGNGIPQNIIDKIFQPFFTTKPTGQGTGLGLSLSYDIIKAHNGEIKVESKDGITQFTIIIPQ